MYVDFYRLSKSGSEKIGSIHWSGHGWRLEPKSETLENILAQPVYHPKYPRGVNSLESPELFLRSLAFQYRSAYLRATPAYEDAADEEKEKKSARNGKVFRDLYYEKAAGPHKFSSTQFNLEHAGYSRTEGSPLPRLQELADAIADEDLAADGREDEHHVTVKYGLHTQDPEDVRHIVEGFGPVVARLGKVSLFPASESSAHKEQDEQYDVVKVDIDSPDLRRLNRLLCKSLEHTDTHPNYKPHVTLAYVKPGLGKKYVGKGLGGHEVHLNLLTFSDREGNRTEIGLTPGAARLAGKSSRRKAMSGTKTIWLVRHGKTALNAANPDEDRIRGWRDVPLSDEGQEEARRLAKWFKSKPLGEIISSDFQRTEQTAIKIAIASDTEIRELTKAMRPWNVGKYTGELSSKVHPILEKYCTERPDERLPGGESFNEFKGRCLEYVARLMEEESPKPLLVVSHFRNLKLVQGWIEAGAHDPGPDAELDMETFLDWKDVPTGAILRLTQTGGRPWRWEIIERAQGQNKEEREAKR